MEKTLDIYKYDDFRQFLGECYKKKKEENPKYSYRKFAKQAGFTNPGYINDVIKGRRQLSKAALKKIIKVFDIIPADEDFFKLLVEYGQEKKLKNKDSLYKKVLFRRSRSSYTRLNPQLVKYYQDYRYPLLRSAIEVCDFTGNYEKLAKFLNPSLPTNVVIKMVRDLCDWGLVQQKPDGSYVVTSKFVEPPETMAQLIRQLNRTWISHGEEALSKYTPDERYITSTLMGISRETQQVIREKIETFRSEIFNLIQKDNNPEILLQLSMMYFPKSHIEVKK